MSECRFYKVADHIFSVSVDESVATNTNGTADFFARSMDNYAPFVIPSLTRNQIFSLSVLPFAPFDYTEEIRQEDEGQTIICGHRLAGESVFEFLLRDIST